MLFRSRLTNAGQGDKYTIEMLSKDPNVLHYYGKYVKFFLSELTSQSLKEVITEYPRLGGYAKINNESSFLNGGQQIYQTINTTPSPNTSICILTFSSYKAQ